jgi:uncharacterized protein
MSNHPIVHIEFPATDPKAAGAFYGEVFGWQVEQYAETDPSFDYHMFRAEGGPGGAFVKTTEEPSAGGIVYKIGEPLLYIHTDDIDAALAAIEQHGGKIQVPRTEIPQNGWYAVFTDPSGNRVGLYTGPGQQG